MSLGDVSREDVTGIQDVGQGHEPRDAGSRQRSQNLEKARNSILLWSLQKGT